MHQRDARQLTCSKCSIKSDLFLRCRELKLHLHSFTIFICETAGCKYGAPKQDFQVSAAGVDRLMFQWTFLSSNHIYIQYQGMPSIRWLLLWNMCEKNRKELCVWLWYFLVGPTDTYIHAHADCMNAHSKSINLSLSLYIIYNISIYLSFSLAIFLSLSMYMHTYISIQYTCM